MPPELDADAHPLVATPTILTAHANRLPGPAGERRPTGTFGRRSTETMLAIGEAIFSTSDRPCPPDRLDYLRRELGDLMGRAAPRGRLLFTLGAFAVSVIAPLLVGRLPPFRRLPLDVRIAALRKLEARQLGAVLIALRAVLCLLYYEHPDAAAEIGIRVTEGGRLE
ncbi:MAG: hypothetical protein RIT81_38095 [Deltaproteobacteria bacterium]